MHIMGMTKLAEWMSREGLDDASLAPKLNISRSQVCRIRLGQSRPSPGVAISLSEISGIPLAELLTLKLADVTRNPQVSIPELRS